jgi:type I restriction enzyme, R subunit
MPFIQAHIALAQARRRKKPDPWRQRIRHVDLGPLDGLADRLAASPPAETLALFREHPSLATVLDGAQPGRPRDSIFISEHEDELVSGLKVC